MGMSDFWMATPFMLTLILLSFHKSIKHGACACIFVAACILINVTIYKNPLVFPVLQGDIKVEILKDSIYVKYGDGSGSFVQIGSYPGDYSLSFLEEKEKQLLNEFLSNENATTTVIKERTLKYYDDSYGLYKFKAGQKFRILGVKNDGGIDSKNETYVLTEAASFKQSDIDKGIIQLPVKVQSTWSVYLGYLMAWPMTVLSLL